MFCPACHQTVPASASRCPACGAAATEDPEATVMPEDLEPTQVRLGEAATQALPNGEWSKAATASDKTAYQRISSSDKKVLGGRYEILKTLGEGGMGSVFKARDIEVDRIVALKVIRPELAGSADILRRFRQELVLARQITHRNVVRIYDLGMADGVRFISMEYIEGEELWDMLKKRGKLPPKEAAGIMLQVCQGLAVAHAEGVVHRDLKPQNIMIDKQGRAAVMDFGIAHSTDVAGLTEAGAESGTEQASHLTRVGALLGTPRYMSPEQARAERVDKRSDLFTVGLILYELTIGNLPSKGTFQEMLAARAKEPIQPPIHADPQFPRPLNDIIVRCLQLSPADRYQSASEIVRDLEIWLGLRKRHQTNWLVVAGMSALILASAGGLYFGLRPKAAVAHAPMKILVSDLANRTGDPVLNGTLEPILSTALEGASFITAYNRGDARKLLVGLSPGATLDDNGARLVAQREGVPVVVSGSIERSGGEYMVSARAIDARTNKVIDQEKSAASAPNELNRAIVRIASGFRKALGDATPQSVQLASAETFSSQSLEASQQYAQAQELQWAGKWGDALRAYRRSTEIDPSFGRAYAGMAVMLANMGQRQDAEKEFKLALSKVDRMSDREKYRTRGAYYLLERNYDKAIEEFKALEKQYPADSAGIGNLALADFYARNMTGAVEEERRVVELNPNNVLYLNNLGLFAMYAGDFDGAIRESERLLQINPRFEKAYICLGISQLARGDDAAAAETYRKVAPLSAWGASASTAGLADIALYEGRPAEALPILETGLRGDLAAKASSRAAAKYILQAQAWIMQGQRAKAIAAAERASGASSEESLLYPAAMLFLEAGKEDKALELSEKLNQRLEPDPGAYSKLIVAEIQLKRKNYRDAVRTFQDSRKIADAWIGHLGLGRAYLEAGAFTEADTELEACVKRRGEATAVFLDDEPSWRYFAPVYYYLGRAREGLQSPEAADAYQNYLKLRGKSAGDPLVQDAQKRLRALEGNRASSRQ